MNVKPSLILFGLGVVVVLSRVGTMSAALALPPPEDVPEEILRTEIIVEGRSPIDGSPLNPADYAQVQDGLQNPDRVPQLDPKIQEIIFLLQIRRTLLNLLPFLPI